MAMPLPSELLFYSDRRPAASSTILRSAGRNSYFRNPSSKLKAANTEDRLAWIKLATFSYGLTDAEVASLTEAAKGNRHGHRDATMIMVAYRHGFRVSELVDLRWDQIDFDTGTLAVRRVKKGSPSTHHVLGDELRALRRLNREQEPKSPFVFTSERGSPFTTAGFARLVERAGAAAELGFKALTPICCGTPVDSPWPIRGTIHAPCRPTWGTRISSTRCAIPSCHRIGSRISGGERMPT
jgi:integrase